MKQNKKTNKKVIKTVKQKPETADLGECGKVTILEVRDNPDGTASIDFEVDDKFIAFYKKQKKVKKATEKGIGDFLNELLTKAVNKQDGYDLETLGKKA